MSPDGIQRTFIRTTDRPAWNGHTYSMEREIELRAAQNNRCICGESRGLRCWYGAEKTAQAMLCGPCRQSSKQLVEELQEEIARLTALAEWHRQHPRNHH